MRPLLSECRTNVGVKLASAKAGEFFRLEEGEATELEAMPALMKTEQMSEEDIIAVARQSKLE